MKDSRYQRQVVLKDFGPQAQEKLRNSSVLVVGVGGLGIPVLQYLNAMGVGILGMIDQDIVDISNLHRQVLFAENEIELPKVEVALNKLKAQNSQTKFIIHDTFLVKDNALEIIENYDLVVDASDNFATRYLVNDACVILRKPFVYGALHGFEGQVSVFNYQDGPTYRCLFPMMPGSDEIPDCNEQGVLGVLPGIIGNFQALEAVKLLTGIGVSLSGFLMIYNGLEQSTRKIKLPIIPANKQIKELAERYEPAYCEPKYEVDSQDLKNLIRNNENVLMVDVRTKEEFELYHLPDSIHIDLDDLESQFSSLKKQEVICFICQSGVRSAKALYLLKREVKTPSLFHLKGGIDAYKILAG